MKAIVYPELTPAGTAQRWTLTVDGTVGEVIMRDGFYGAFIGEKFLGTFAKPGPAGLAIQQEIRGSVDTVEIEDDEIENYRTPAGSKSSEQPPVLTQQDIALVLADQRESWTPEEMTDQECLEHVYNTLLVKDIFGDDPTAQAYRRVLTARWGATA